jgi:hypothetical protein
MRDAYAHMNVQRMSDPAEGQLVSYFNLNHAYTVFNFVLAAGAVTAVSR